MIMELLTQIAEKTETETMCPNSYYLEFLNLIADQLVEQDSAQLLEKMNGNRTED